MYIGVKVKKPAFLNVDMLRDFVELTPFLLTGKHINLRTNPKWLYIRWTKFIWWSQSCASVFFNPTNKCINTLQLTLK